VDDVVQQVARSLNVQMYRSGGTRAAVLGPEQVQADDLAMQGWGVQGWGVYLRGLSRENFLAALPLLSRRSPNDDGRAIVATHLQRHPGARAADVAKLLRGDAPPFVAGRTRVMESLRELGMP
jgi:hypothetical protein